MRRNIPAIIRDVRLGIAERHGADEEQNLSDDEILGFWATYLRADGIRDLTAYTVKILGDAPYLETFMASVEPVCCRCVQWYENCKCQAA